MSRMPTPPAAADAPRGIQEVVETGMVMTDEAVERLAHAAARWQLRRPAVWRSFTVPWLVALAVAGFVLWRMPPVRLDRAWLLAVAAVALLVVLDAFVMLPRRIRRRERGVVAARFPVGTPVHATWSRRSWSVGGFGSVQTVPTGTVVRGTWSGGVLLLRTTTGELCAVDGELLATDAWAVVSDVLGRRLVGRRAPRAS